MNTREYNVWNEGYAATGGSCDAQYVGVGIGESFEDAVKDALIKKGWDMYYYNEERNTYYGCRFFDNEHGARASFG